MKIAVIKLGARITWDTDGAVAPGEAVSICKALARGGAEVHVFTKLLAKDTLHPSLTWHNITEDTDTTGLDLLVIINGNVNFFGGAEDEAQIKNYVLLNHCAAPAVYIMCDPELPFQQIWESVAKKPWGGKYKREDVLVEKNNIRVLSQPFALDKIEADWPKKAVKPLEFFHFPMERFPLLNEWLPPMEAPEVDLLYGGTHRGGRRIPNLFKWYWNLPKDISVEIFGNIEAQDFVKHNKVGPSKLMAGTTRAPKFSGKVKYDQVLPKMNTALAHLVTGDPSYEVLDIIPQRTYENIAAGNVVFVDAAMDESRRIYPAGTLAHDFLYVREQAELVERLRQVKEDPELRAGLLQAQRDATNFNADKFCQDLVKKLAWKCT